MWLWLYVCACVCVYEHDIYVYICGLPLWFSGKESACNAGDTGLIPWPGRSPGRVHGTPLQYSCLENQMDRGAWRATAHSVQKRQTRLNQLSTPVYRRMYNASMLLISIPFLDVLLMFHLKSVYWLWIHCWSQKIASLPCHFGWTMQTDQRHFCNLVPERLSGSKFLFQDKMLPDPRICAPVLICKGDWVETRKSQCCWKKNFHYSCFLRKGGTCAMWARTGQPQVWSGGGSRSEGNA